MSDQVSKSEFEARVRSFLEERTGTSGDELDPDADLLATGVIDSLLLVEFLFQVEEMAGSEIAWEDLQAEEVASLNGAYRLLRDSWEGGQGELAAGGI